VKNLLIATTNKGKQTELLALFKDSRLLLRTPEDIRISLHVKETGSTYAENALLKSSAFCTSSGLPALADDTGLEVDALGGAPGLYSARFSPKPNASDRDRRALLLSKLNGHPQPWTARFVCAMALVLPDGRVFSSLGICAGEIIRKECGDSGFGYDRIFLCAGNGRTMAELDTEEKNSISHRGQAAAEMLEHIRSIFI